MPETTISVANALATLILGGFLGLLGQGARAIVGLKGLQDQVDNPDVSQKDVFSAARLLMSLMIGFLAGLAATLAMGIGKLLPDPSNIDVLLGIAGAGYVGTDVIEGFMSRFTPSSKPATSVEKSTESAPAALESGLQYHNAVMTAAFKVQDLIAARTAPAPLNAGSVNHAAYHRGPPSLAEVKSRVVALSTYQDPKATDTTPLSTLEPNGNRALARACMHDRVPYNSSGHSFQSDGLHFEPNIQDPSVKTLRDFADHILNCYTRYPVGPVA